MLYLFAAFGLLFGSCLLVLIAVYSLNRQRVRRLVYLHLIDPLDTMLSTKTWR